MYPPPLIRALNTLGRGLHAKKRADLDVVEAYLKSYHDGLTDLLGPGHLPPEGVELQSLNVAKPAIQAAYWTDGPWHCLRIEERTVGHNRPRAWFNKATGRPQLRNDPSTEQWMQWVQKILRELGVMPLSGAVRLVFFPGLVYTFVSWRNVDHREEKLLHPMDCDNASKATTDPLMVPKPPKEPGPTDKPAPKKVKPVVTPTTGAYFDDAQVVDLLVFRLPQQGKPRVDRLALHKKRSATRKAVVAKNKAKKSG